MVLCKIKKSKKVDTHNKTMKGRYRVEHTKAPLFPSVPSLERKRGLQACETASSQIGAK